MELQNMPLNSAISDVTNGIVKRKLEKLKRICNVPL